jgi:hypothetical protein
LERDQENVESGFPSDRTTTANESGQGAKSVSVEPDPAPEYFPAKWIPVRGAQNAAKQSIRAPSDQSERK